MKQLTQTPGEVSDQGSERRGGRIWPPVAVFYVVTLLAAGLLGLVQPATGLSPVVLQLTQFGPVIGVLAVAVLWRKRTRTDLADGLRAGRMSAVRAAALLGTPVLIMALCVGGYAALGADVHYTAPGSLAEPFPLILVAQFIGACAEELGWRCFLQPLLRTRARVVGASLTVGLLWGAWHVPVIANGPVYAAAFLVQTLALSVILGLALDRSGRSRLPLAGGFHMLVNIGLLLLMNEESGTIEPMLMLDGATVIAAALWLLAGRRQDRPAVAGEARVPVAGLRL
jgi:membrane protease YdiL (CAAX protease family)